MRSTGLRDEFRDLADAFDTMLDRLQASSDEQRRFAANASHELRTPYATERAMLDVALADPAGVDVPRLLSRLDVTNRRGTETVQALLALAALDSGPIPTPGRSGAAGPAAGRQPGAQRGPAQHRPRRASPSGSPPRTSDDGRRGPFPVGDPPQPAAGSTTVELSAGVGPVS